MNTALRDPLRAPLYPGRSLLSLLSLLALSAPLAAPLLAGCDGSNDGFTTATYSAIDLPRNATFASLGRGETSSNKLIKIQQAGEQPLSVTRIYLATEDPATKVLTELSGCDRITEGVDPSLPLQPSVLPECSFLISERPATLPVTITPGSFEQVLLTYRPLAMPAPENARLVVESDAFQDYVRVVELSISESIPELGGAPAIEFSGSGRSTESYLVRNLASGELLVTNVIIEPDPDYPAYVDPATGVETLEFSVDGGCPLPCRLSTANNNYTTLQVTYDPKDEGVDKATLVVEGTTLGGDPLPSLRVQLTSEVTPLVLNVSPSPVTFEHRAGSTVTKTLNFQNSALRPLNVLDLMIEESDAFRIPSAELTSFQLSGGESRLVSVTYNAPSDPQRATLVVRTNAENAEGGYLRVPLVAEGSGGLSLLSSSEGTLSFNAVEAGMSSEQTLTLSSSGTDPVNLMGYSLEGDAEVFAVTGDLMGALATGGTRELQVTFTRPPDEPVANTYQATLSIESDSAGGAVLVTLIANP